MSILEPALPSVDPLLDPHAAHKPRPDATFARRLAVHIPWVLSAAVLLFFVLAAIAPNLLAPVDPLAINPGEAFSAPGAGHLLGTDESGRDIYSRIVHGSRTSLLIGAAATGIGLSLALALGTVAGFGARWHGIHLSGIDKIDAMLHRPFELRVRFGLSVLLAPSHRAQAHDRDVQIGVK